MQHLAELGFEVCFVSNSELSPESVGRLKQSCARVIVRENTGLDFGMWQRGLAEYDPAQLGELLLTNSSIIGPLQPLGALWQNQAGADCDFWGLTDNDEFKPHLSSYFLVFRQPVLHSARFRDFWRTILPYQNKFQVVFSYELGLSNWLEEGGFRWRAAFPQQQVIAAHRSGRGFWGRCLDRCQALSHLHRNRELPPRNTTLVYPDVLLQHGMPFLKVSLLQQSSLRITPPAAFSLLEKFNLPPEILQELRRTFPAS
ncbi:MAG: rhamnan synthesis F family protein [Verrucomicrobiota bacterium]